MRIRDVEFDDIHDVHELVSECCTDTAASCVKILDKCVKSLVAEDKGVIVGFVQLDLRHITYTGAEITYLCSKYGNFSTYIELLRWVLYFCNESVYISISKLRNPTDVLRFALSESGFAKSDSIIYVKRREISTK